FDVADVVDDVAPAAPVVQVQRDDSGLGCGSGGSSLLLNFDDSVAVDDVALWRVQPGDLRIALTVDGLAVSEKLAELPKQVTVTAIDLAGNESAPTTVDVEDAGCASVPAASMSALAVLLLLVRRRRP
ncbi:MAG TPA: MYXO-CTERM sorting domain-containing protein, partial [Myxococcota bacterium]